MICYVCELGEIRIGTTTITLEREGFTIVVNEVPAQICSNCGEKYIDNQTRDQLLRIAARGASHKPGVAFRDYTTTTHHR